MKIDARKLQHAFAKHAQDFGITGTWNPANGKLLEQAIHHHIAKSHIQRIAGTFRGTIPVTHYFDSATGLNVMVDTTDTFVAGWILSAAQRAHLLSSGNVQ